MKPKELQNLTSPSFNLQKLPGKFKNLFRKFENLTVSGFGSFICHWTGTPEIFSAHKPFTSSFPFKVFNVWEPHSRPPSSSPPRWEGSWGDCGFVFPREEDTAVKSPLRHPSTPLSVWRYL